jgi:hypothetical protein
MRGYRIVNCEWIRIRQEMIVAHFYVLSQHSPAEHEVNHKKLTVTKIRVEWYQHTNLLG